MIKFSIIAFILLLCFWTFVTCIELTGDHICHKQENYTETINSTTKEPIQVRKNFWCMEKIRCSEMMSDIKEIVHAENVTRSRVIKFCCPGYEENDFDGKKICKKIENGTSTTSKSVNNSIVSTEKNPYMNYSGEYGKEFNHYMKMGLNESDAQQSVNKLMEMEYKHALNEQLAEDADQIILLDVSGNEIESLKHPQYVTDHHGVNHHEENIAMVTVGCLILGMLIFLLLMVYIMRKQQPRERDIEIIDPNFESKKTKLPPSKIIHEPLPIPPLRPSLRKHKSVTFDNSIDEVDEFNRRRTKSLPDAYDIPRKQTSMIDLYAQSVKITPKDIATYTIMSQKSAFHTFPRKNISRKQSLEHIYDEIPTLDVIREEIKKESEKCEHKQKADAIYENQETNANEGETQKKTEGNDEKTRM